MKALVIMTRVPVPNKTKTRLLSIFKPEECSEIHKSFLRDILETASQITKDTDLFLFYGNEGPVKILNEFAQESVSFFPQEGQGLGEKMANIFEKIFSKGYNKVVLIGADIPEVSLEDLNDSFDILDSNDVVFGPTDDGGYYLVGMNRPHDIIFRSDIKWGTPEVFQESIKSLENMKIEVGLIRFRSDIDTEGDLKEFWKRVKGTENCKNTQKYLLENIGERLLCQKN
jgi:hypothetical protein